MNNREVQAYPRMVRIWKRKQSALRLERIESLKMIVNRMLLD